jgi:hypothetical protein
VGNVPFHKQVIPGSQIVMEAVNTITEPVICKTVLSPLNAGLGSLRAAVACAQPGDTITIALNPGDTIVLTGAPIIINKNLVIRSVSTDKRAIKAPGTMPVFNVASGKALTLQSLYMQGTDVVVENHGSLILLSSEIKKTSASASSPVMNYGQATVKGTVHVKQ